MKISKVWLFPAAILLAIGLLATSADAKDQAQKDAENLAKWQEKVKKSFESDYDKHTDETTVSTKYLVVCRSPIFGPPKPNIDLVVSYKFKGQTLKEKPEYVDVIFMYFLGSHDNATRAPVGTREEDNYHIMLNFIVDGHTRYVTGLPKYKFLPNFKVEQLTWTLHRKDFESIFSGKVFKAQIGIDEFKIKDLELLVVKEALKRMNAIP